MTDIEPVRPAPKKLAGRQQRHVEIELAGFERGIRAAVLHRERTGKSGRSPDAGVTAAHRQPSAATPMSGERLVIGSLPLQPARVHGVGEAPEHGDGLDRHPLRHTQSSC
jgi:hypothetical protein